jgi:hypothetical protein
VVLSAPTEQKICSIKNANAIPPIPLISSPSRSRSLLSQNPATSSTTTPTRSDREPPTSNIDSGATRYCAQTTTKPPPTIRPPKPIKSGDVVYHNAHQIRPRATHRPPPTSNIDSGATRYCTQTNTKPPPTTQPPDPSSWFPSNSEGDEVV